MEKAEVQLVVETIESSRDRQVKSLADPCLTKMKTTLPSLSKDFVQVAVAFMRAVITLV